MPLRFLLFCFLVASASPAQSLSHTLAEQYLFSSVNAERAQHGLAPLAWNEPLQNAADYHAARMRSTRTLSHQLAGEADLPARAAGSGARFSRVAENVAVGQSVPQMHEALMHSPHHRENILDPAVDSVAISVVAGRGELWAVEDFTRGVQSLRLSDQESEVIAMLTERGVTAQPTTNARSTCALDTGYVGPRPWFVMRYTTSDLAHLPEQLLSRLLVNSFRFVAVGACPPAEADNFSSYNVAVLLYR